MRRDRYVCIECGAEHDLTEDEWWVSVCLVCEGELEPADIDVEAAS